MALVVPDKAQRVRNFHRLTLESLKELLESAGLNGPSDLRLHHFMRRINAYETRSLAHLFQHVPQGALTSNTPASGQADLPDVFKAYWDGASAQRFMPETLH
jgi:hypothetical protein